MDIVYQNSPKSITLKLKHIQKRRSTYIKLKKHIAGIFAHLLFLLNIDFLSSHMDYLLIKVLYCSTRLVECVELVQVTR